MTEFKDYAPLDRLPADVDYKWSGGDRLPAIPAVGDTIDVRVNNLGRGTVIGYFLARDPDRGVTWAGVRVNLFNPPEWFLKNCAREGRVPTADMFGAECAPAPYPIPSGGPA